MRRVWSFVARARAKEDEEGEEEDCGSRGASQNEVWRRKKRDESKSIQKKFQLFKFPLPGFLSFSSPTFPRREDAVREKVKAFGRVLSSFSFSSSSSSSSSSFFFLFSALLFSGVLLAERQRGDFERLLLSLWQRVDEGTSLDELVKIQGILLLFVKLGKD